MRVQPIHEVHTLTSSQESIHATIDAENLGVVLNMLSNVYSDPVYAVLREYSTNALDSHVAAGNTSPIEVSLPDAESSQPQLVVRDFGVGLDLAELRKTYLSYGASTKRDSDDFNGTLGIGSKSGLTYAPLGFQVAAVKDGHKILAVIAQDEQGVGVMEILAEFNVAEPNGVTITIPVQSDDCWKFEEKAKHLYRFWGKGTVLVDGEAPASIHDDEEVIWLDDDVAITRAHQSYIVMGNVPYRVDFERSYGYNVIATVPMGSVHFTPSREELHYTELTNETIETLTEFVNERADRVVEEFIKGAGPGFLRLKEYHALLSHLQAYGAQRRKFERAMRPFLPADPQTLPRVTNADGTVTQKVGYRWQPGRRNGTNVFEMLHYSAIRETNDVVIVGFPYQSRSLTTTQKARLNRWVNEGNTNWRGGRLVILPEGVTVDTYEMLDGRPNIYTWQDVVDATPPLPRQAGGGSRSKTQYLVFHQGTMTRQEVLDPKVGPIVTHPHHRYGIDADKCPEAQHVMLKGNQWDRFMRLHPTAISYSTYLHHEQQKALKALTEKDGMRHHGESWRWLVQADGRIDDPELAEVVRQISGKTGPSKAYGRAATLGVRPERPAVLATLAERYPLLGSIHDWRYDSARDEIVLYLNAKWAQQEEERAVAEAAEIIANAASIQVDVDGADGSV
jgi:hypothetical protein